MNNEKLKRATELKREIDDLQFKIKVLEKAVRMRAVLFVIKDERCAVEDEILIHGNSGFQGVKEAMLKEMRDLLNEWQRQFDKL